MGKTPFNFGIYFNTIKGLLGRKPDKINRKGGLITYTYLPKVGEVAMLEKYAGDLTLWLNEFDTSRFEEDPSIGVRIVPCDNSNKALQITIPFPQT